MKKVYITHATEKYLNVAHNLATSIRAFSDIPVVVYCVDVKQKDTYIFQNIDLLIYLMGDMNTLIQIFVLDHQYSHLK